MKPPWTHAKRARAITLAQAGKSRYQIAQLLGSGFTKNMVAKLLYTEKLKSGHVPVRRPPRLYKMVNTANVAEVPQRAIKISLAEIERRKERVRSRARDRKKKLKQVAAGASRSGGVGIPCALADLPANSCKFAVTPHHARKHLFCGLSAPTGSSWCDIHWAKVWLANSKSIKGAYRQ